MSLMTMRHKMASKRTTTIILWALILVFAVTAVFWSLSPSKLGGGKTSYSGPGSKNVIATVNGKAIVAGELDEKYAGSDEAKQSRQFTSAMQGRMQAFDSLVQESVQNQVVKEVGIHIWPWSLRSFTKELAQLQIAMMRDSAKKQAAVPPPAGSKEAPKTADQIFADNLKQTLEQLDVKKDNPTEADFINAVVGKVSSDKNMKERITSFFQMNGIGESVIKKMPVISPISNPLSEQYVQKLFTKDVKASIIIVSAKDGTPVELENARQKAQKLRDGIVSDPSSFAAKAKESADMMSAMKGGDLGWLQGYLPQNENRTPIFTEYLAYALDKNSISPIMLMPIISPFGGPSSIGYGFVKVDDIRDRADLAAFKWDVEKKKAMADSKMRYSIGIGQAYLETSRLKAVIVRKTDELKYYEARTKFDQKAMTELIPKIADDTSLPPEINAAAKYEQLQTEKDPVKKAALISSIVSYAPPQMQMQLTIQLAQAYSATNKKDEALSLLQAASAGIDSSDPDGKAHADLKAEFQKLGSAKDVKAMDDWIKAHPAPKKPAPGAMSIPMNMPSGAR